MGNELELKEMLDFIYSYNVNSNRNNILLNQTIEIIRINIWDYQSHLKVDWYFSFISFYFLL